ncbi:MAG: hypothetical protein BECKG1743E_GA0114224_103951, partial [Candidatus Kentron sp. G]
LLRVPSYYYPAISCFLCTFFQARTQREGEAPAEPLENRSNPLRLGRSLALPERSRFAIWLRFPALCSSWIVNRENVHKKQEVDG